MLVAQLLAIAYAFFSAMQEKTVVRAMIDYAPPGNRYEKPFHKNGAVMTFLFCLVCGLGFGVEAGILAALWYWLVFDISLNLLLEKKWYYTGTTAALDKLINGKAKAIVVALLIIAVNVLHVLMR